MDIGSARKLAQKNNSFGAVKVLENQHYRFMCMANATIQSILDLKQAHQLVSPTTQAMLLPLLFSDISLNSILSLGLGGGDIQRFVNHFFPKCQQLAVEINPAVIELAQEYFLLPEMVNLETMDFQQYLTKNTDSVDGIFWDLFIDDAMVAIESKQLEQCFDTLNSNGFLAINAVFADELSCFNVLKALRQIFTKRVFCIELAERKNIILLAFKQQPAYLSRTELEQRARDLQKQYQIPFNIFIESLFSLNPTQPSGDDQILVL